MTRENAVRIAKEELACYDAGIYGPGSAPWTRVRQLLDHIALLEAGIKALHTKWTDRGEGLPIGLRHDIEALL